jgi:choline-sulfatase
MDWASRLGLARDTGPRFSVRKTDERPDIVLFLTDEQRHDEVGYASGGYYETPALDRLAERGVVFETAYSGSSVCVPSRVSLLTGLLPPRAPTQGNGLALREGFWTLARALRAIGYQTALVGKMHFSPMYARHGFDVMQLAEHLVPFSGYGPGEVDDYHLWLMWEGLADHRATHMFGPGLEEAAEEFRANYFAVKFPHSREAHPIGWIARTAVDVVEKRKSGTPLFLIVSFPRPHAPYDPAEPYASMYDPVEARPPADGFEVNAGLPESFRKLFVHDDAQFFNPWPVTRLTEEVYRRVLTYVRALVRQVDDAMDDVLRSLDLGNTVVFFTSDHGTYGGQRGLLGKVPWVPLEPLVRVPFVCAAPGALRGRRVKEPVQSFDFVPTCLDYAGIDAPRDLFDATSLRQVIQGYPAPRRSVFSATPGGWPMVRSGAHKLILGSGGEDLLFDLDADPGETKNLAGDPARAHVLAALRRELAAALSRPEPPLLGEP